ALARGLALAGVLGGLAVVLALARGDAVTVHLGLLGDRLGRQAGEQAGGGQGQGGTGHGGSGLARHGNFLSMVSRPVAGHLTRVGEPAGVTAAGKKSPARGRARLLSSGSSADADPVRQG